MQKDVKITKQSAKFNANQQNQFKRKQILGIDG